MSKICNINFWIGNDPPPVWNFSKNSSVLVEPPFPYRTHYYWIFYSSPGPAAELSFSIDWYYLKWLTTLILIMNMILMMITTMMMPMPFWPFHQLLIKKEHLYNEFRSSDSEMLLYLGYTDNMTICCQHSLKWTCKARWLHRSTNYVHIVYSLWGMI